MNVISVVRNSQIVVLFGCIRNVMKIPNLMLVNFAIKLFHIAPIWLCIKGFTQVNTYAQFLNTWGPSIYDVRWYWAGERGGLAKSDSILKGH